MTASMTKLATATKAKTAGYQSGFNNEIETEALPGALPVGQFNPQRAPYGLYAEQFSSTAFTTKRANNRRSWLYRIHPSVSHSEFTPLTIKHWDTSPCAGLSALPNQMRWSPPAMPSKPQTFLTGMRTLVVNGDANSQVGMAAHRYCINESMRAEYFYDADGELLFVPQQGEVTLKTEFGNLEIKPGEIAVIPRGVKFQVVLNEPLAIGYVAENYGAPLELPERGLVGSNGFANQRDFYYPNAAFEDLDGNFTLVAKFAGQFYRANLTHSPLDVVAWVGNSAPYKYDLTRFNVINSVSHDHPDPSIFTVLTSPSDTEGVANFDFVIFPPRWVVSEDTFRPPYFHCNFMSEFMGLIYGEYDGKSSKDQGGFNPGGASVHNCMSAHGPEAAVYEAATNIKLEPTKYEQTLAFMFESRYPFVATDYARTTETRQLDYMDCWAPIKKHFNPDQR